jgi:hypothetical protein
VAGPIRIAEKDSRSSCKNALVSEALGVWLVLAGPAVFTALAQSTNGSISLTVTDPIGAAVPEAGLDLQNLETNDSHKAVKSASGTHIFPDLSFGRYKLTVAKGRLRYQSVRIGAGAGGARDGYSGDPDAGRHHRDGDGGGRGSAGGGRHVEPDRDTIDTRQVVNLPVNGRNIMSFAFLAPGWANTTLTNNDGTWNNMPGGAVVGADFDGTPGISNRFRSGGFNYGTTAVQPRIEDVAEMTVSRQLDLSGTGTSAMRIAIVTRHGTNEFHGRVYEDFRNTVLNANSWSNNARGLPRNILKLNDFGVSAGGPIIKNKLFFFGTYAESIQPGNSSATANVLSPSAQQGIVSYQDAAGNTQTANTMQIAGAAGFPRAVNPIMGGQLQTINSVLGQGTLTPTSDPNINTLNFRYSSRTTTYYPYDAFSLRSWLAAQSARIVGGNLPACNACLCASTLGSQIQVL